MSDTPAYQPNSGAFSKARSHIMLVVGILTASGVAWYLERLNPENCRAASATEAHAPLR